VVVFTTGDRLRIEVRHRPPGSAQPDSTLTFLGIPARPGTYRLQSPGISRGPAASFTTRSEQVGSMRDFTHAVSGSLTLAEQTSGMLAASFRVAAQEPPPPVPTPRPGEPAAALGGRRPPPPPARIEATGRFPIDLEGLAAAPLASRDAGPG
jgi:hypothetical protein